MCGWMVIHRYTYMFSQRPPPPPSHKSINIRHRQSLFLSLYDIYANTNDYFVCCYSPYCLIPSYVSLPEQENLQYSVLLVVCHIDLAVPDDRPRRQLIRYHRPAPHPATDQRVTHTTTPSARRPTHTVLLSTRRLRACGGPSIVIPRVRRNPDGREADFSTALSESPSQAHESVAIAARNGTDNGRGCSLSVSILWSSNHVDDLVLTAS